jgi:hypothetical protein
MDLFGGTAVRLNNSWKIDLNGRWHGNYGPHGIEVVEIEETPDGRVVATKVTGDPNVPPGEITFEAQINWRRGKGRGRIAQSGFVDPRWVAGVLEIVDPDRIVFHWQGVGSVAFHRDPE